jgi:hypothetical protein
MVRETLYTRARVLRTVMSSSSSYERPLRSYGTKGMAVVCLRTVNEDHCRGGYRITRENSHVINTDIEGQVLRHACMGKPIK